MILLIVLLLALSGGTEDLPYVPEEVVISEVDKEPDSGQPGSLSEIG
jgi:hypothetical protein